MQHAKKSPKTKTIITATLLTGALVLVGFTSLASAYKFWPFNISPSTNAPSTETLNQSDPTYSSEKNRDSNSDPSTNTDHGSISKSHVQVGISSAFVTNSSLEVHSFVTGAIEGTGKCTVTATHDRLRIDQTSPGFIDASTTQCEPVSIPLEKFEVGGDWAINTAYSSPTSEGISDSITVEIPE